MNACRTALDARCSSATTVPSGRSATPVARAPAIARMPPKPAAGEPSASRRVANASALPVFPTTASRPSGASAIAVATSSAVPPVAGKVSIPFEPKSGSREPSGRRPASSTSSRSAPLVATSVAPAAQPPVGQHDEVGGAVVAGPRGDRQHEPAVAREARVERAVGVPRDDPDVEAAARSGRLAHLVDAVAVDGDGVRRARQRAGRGTSREGAVGRQARVDRRPGRGRKGGRRGERRQERELEPEGHVVAAM